MAGKGSGEQVIREMKKRGLTPNVGLLCETPQAIITAVAKQMGVGVLFEEMVTPEIKSGKFRMLELPSGDFGGESIVDLLPIEWVKIA